jgi:hypothetical protein
MSVIVAFPKAIDINEPIPQLRDILQVLAKITDETLPVADIG